MLGRRLGTRSGAVLGTLESQCPKGVGRRVGLVSEIAVEMVVMVRLCRAGLVVEMVQQCRVGVGQLRFARQWTRECVRLRKGALVVVQA